MTTDQQAATKLNLTSPTNTLLEAATKVITVVPTKSPKPVLSNIRFTVEDGILELSGTDSVAGIYYGIPSAALKAEGTGLLNGARFLELLKEFKGTDARLTFNNRGGCQFKAKGGNYKIIGDDPRDYPKIPRFDAVTGFEIPGSDVADMAKKTLFAIAPEESRMTTNGVLFELKSGRFRMVATDNKRMSITERQVDTELEDFSVSVPDIFLKAVIKMTSKDIAGKNATIGVSGTKVFYRLSTATLYCTTLQGTYPPYEEALNINLKYHIDCSVKDLLLTLRRSILVDDSLNAFNFETEVLSLKTTTSGVGTGLVDMPIDFMLPEGEPKIRIGFNASYIKEALEAMTAKRCRFAFEGPRSAGIFKEIFSGDSNEVVSDQFVYAVMPALLPPEE
jgi:DNA polymerase-3 subunit beta